MNDETDARTRRMNPILKTIFQRRSIRKYTNQPVEMEKLDLLLQAGMSAPSAMNCKPWEFVVVTDPEKLAQFRKRLLYGNRNAPAAIVVCGNPSLTINPASRQFWVQDCSAATENILIAAVGLGLGTVWVGIHPVAEFVRVVQEITGMPKHVTPLGLIYVGYPAEEKPARTQYDERRVHWQKYERQKRRAKIKNAKLPQSPLKEKEMTAQIIDGKMIAQQVRDTVAGEVAKRAAAGKPKPGLATVLVGDRVDSATYVASKQKACQELGMESFHNQMPGDATQEQVEELVRRLNADPKVNGILVQLPLPAHLNEERVLQLINIEKDVDGFSPINIGRLAQKGRDPLFVPCTPYGCIYLLEQAGVKIEGANAVVLGRSNIVGMPAALLLISRNATVTVCHSRTRDLPAVVRQADILIAAIGKTEMVRGDWIKPGAAVIDVGINSVPDATKKSGHRLVGDVNFNEAKEVAGFITPVPGGVGPMTIAMLMKNTLRAAEIQEQ